jgi:hypothetical protein
MKNLLSTLVMLILGWNCWAQNTGINYQAVILNPNPVEIPGTFIQNQVLVQSKVTIRLKQAIRLILRKHMRPKQMILGW